MGNISYEAPDISMERNRKEVGSLGTRWALRQLAHAMEQLLHSATSTHRATAGYQ